jgi:hypothetical protein
MGGLTNYVYHHPPKNKKSTNRSDERSEPIEEVINEPY